MLFRSCSSSSDTTESGGSCITLPVCGNNLIEVSEACDGTDLGGETCVSQGYDSGILSCLSDCSGFDTSGCSVAIGGGLIAYYPFNGNANDESGNGNDGTVYGATLTTGKDGNPNSAYEFDGVNDYVSTPVTSQNDLPNDFSISLWFNKKESGTFLSNMDSVAQERGEFHFGWNGWDYTGFCFYYLTADNIAEASCTSQTIQNNLWYYVVITLVKGGNMTFYLNGNLENSITTPTTALLFNPIQLGWNGYSLYFKGSIDEVRIYNRSLSASEITSLTGVTSTVCKDGIDNDGDGSIDLADFGCSSLIDNNEINNGATECSDGIDNDNDGFIDQDDSNCISRNDDSEDIFVGITYYVDGPNPNCDNTNLGTEALPWCTIQHAADTIIAGDTVIVKSGTYSERITFPFGTSGTADAKIVFKAEPRRTVIMQGFNTKHADYLTIEGFNITNTLGGGWLGGGIWIDSDNVEIIDNYFYELGLGIRSTYQKPWPKNVHIANNRIYHAGTGIGAEGENWLIENNEVERLYHSGSGDADYSRFFGDNITFKNNYFHGTSISEIGTAHIDCFQTFDDNGEYARNIIIENNVCSDAHQGIMGQATYYKNSSNIIVRYNLFINGWAWGIDVHDISSMTVIHNTFANIGFHGTGFRGTDAINEIVKDNIFYNMSTSYWASDGAQIVEGDYNLIYLANNPNNPGPNDLIGVDPMFVNPSNLLGPDGVMGTADDGFRLQPGSPACGAGEGGSDIGALACI